MSENTNRKTQIGLFVVLGGVLLLFIIMAFGHLRLFSKTREVALVFQNSISGLSVGAPVNFRGVKVGSVKSITLHVDPQDRKAYIPVIITLETEQVHVVEDNAKGKQINLQVMVDDGLRAGLNLQSLVTGQSNIELDFDKSVPATLHPRITSLPEIPVRLPAMEKLKNTALSDSLHQDLPSLIASMKKTSDQSQETIQTATETIRDLRTQLDVTLEKMDKLLDTGNSQLEMRGKDIHKTLASATATLEALQDILSARSVDRANLDAALRDIAATASSLRGFASDVERNPQLLLMGRRP